MSISRGYSDALILTEGRHRRYTNHDPVIIPRMIRSVWTRTSPTMVRRIGKPVVMREAYEIIPA